MKILMIDQNYIIDRRITLEAESLKKNGHEVEIVAVNGVDALNTRTNVKTIRFDYYKPTVSDLSNYRSRLPKTTDHLIDLKQKLIGRGWPNRISLLISAILNPGEGLLLMDTTRSVSGLTKSILTFTFLIQRAEFKYLINNFFSLFKFKSDGLNYWEKQVLSYAVKNKFSVIHAHDLPSMNVAVEIKRHLSCKLIYDAHELYSYQPGIPKDKAKQMFRLEKKQIQSFDHCIVINQEQAEIMKNDFNFHNFTALTNATSMEQEFDGSRKYNVIREKLNLLNDPLPIILFQGGVNRLRKIDYLIEGVARAKTKVRLVLLTWGGEVPEFKALAESLNVADRVHFVDPVPWQEILYWAASADVGFMPYQPLDINTKLSCPNKMYEFINAETPMIGSSELINVKKVVGGEGFGLVTPLREVEDYAKAIDNFFALDLGQMKKSLKEKKHKYTWEEESKKLVELYQTFGRS